MTTAREYAANATTGLFGVLNIPPSERDAVVGVIEDLLNDAILSGRLWSGSERRKHMRRSSA